MRSLTSWLTAAWVTIVFVGAWRVRPAGPRLAAFVDEHRSDAVRPWSVDRLGSVLRRAAGRPGDPGADRRIGVGAVGAVLALLVSPLAALGVAAVSIILEGLATRRRDRQEEERLVASVPEAIDLFALAASAGYPVPRSLHVVALRAGGPVGAALRRAVRRVEHGERTADALDQVAADLGEPVRPLVSVLCASERYGTPLVPALERLAAEARVDRRRRAEAAVRRVPVKLLFPLVLCTLPAFALLTVVPLLVGAFGSLRL